MRETWTERLVTAALITAFTLTAWQGLRARNTVAVLASATDHPPTITDIKIERDGPALTVKAEAKDADGDLMGACARLPDHPTICTHPVGPPGGYNRLSVEAHYWLLNQKVCIRPTIIAWDKMGNKVEQAAAAYNCPTIHDRSELPSKKSTPPAPQIPKPVGQSELPIPSLE